MKTKLGASFSEHIYTEKPSLIRSNHHSGHGDDVQIRAHWLPMLLFAAGIILLGRLFYLQVINGQQYRLLSNTNRTKTEVIHAPRGIIFDRNNIPLVLNVPGFRETLNEKTTFIESKDALPLLAKGDKNLEIDSLRMYPYKDAFSHVVGYLGQVSQEQLANPDYSAYTTGDVIGQMGLEQQYEKFLKGVNGQKLEEVDATGKVIRILGITDPIPGENLITTLDTKVQQAAYDAMSGIEKGAVIVSRPNGEILALLSKPSFDPNLFTMGQGYKECQISNIQYPISNATESATVSNGCQQSLNESVEQILTAPNQPFLDRAIGGTYPPGSTFKIVVAAAGLEEKKIDAGFTVEDTGILKIGNFSFANWYYTGYGRTEGTVDVVKAIKRSNDIFFYKLGELLGVDGIAQEAAKFGIGSKLGIDLAGEQSGLLPTKEWKKQTMGEHWFTGDDYHYGIGQGYLLTTPLQVNAWTQAIANGGTLYAPHLLESQKSKIKSQNLLSSTSFDLIREGMIEACDTGGVAWPLFQFRVKNHELRSKIDGKDFYIPDSTATSSATPDDVGVRIACKTGTAQHGDDTTLPHSWITLFAPAYNPQIIVTVLAESSGEGSNVAGPIAKKILDAYFGKQ